MGDAPAPDSGLIVRQLRTTLSDLGSLRDDVSVLTAIAMRLDATLTALLTEVRAMHSQHSRLASRVRDFEQEP
jgi:hypothetical protein